MCRDIFIMAERMRKSLDAPIKLYTRCHPRAHIEIFVDCKKRTIILCCSKCDRLITTVKVK